MDFARVWAYSDMIFEGLQITIMASVIALIASLIFGTLVAIMRISPFKSLNWIGSAYVEFFRNIPLLLIILSVFFIFRPSGWIAGTIGLTIYTSAFIAEAIRAGIQSIPKGQMEAARSTGLTYGQAMNLVILPQAIKVVVPPLGNQFLNLVKNSSLLAMVAGGDLMYQADLISSITFLTMNTYVFIAGFYLMLTIPLSFLVKYLEKRFAISG